VAGEFPRALEFGFRMGSLVRPYTVDRMYIHLRLAQNLMRLSEKLLLRKPRTVCTALTGFMQPRRSVFTARYEINI
jgi:hypothetical protein